MQGPPEVRGQKGTWLWAELEAGHSERPESRPSTPGAAPTLLSGSLLPHECPFKFEEPERCPHFSSPQAGPHLRVIRGIVFTCVGAWPRPRSVKPHPRGGARNWWILGARGPGKTTCSTERLVFGHLPRPCASPRGGARKPSPGRKGAPT